jgi:hypothetical protein
MRYSKGIMWLDDCRIPFVDGNDIPQATTQRDSEEMNHKTKEILGYEKWGVGMELDVKRVPYEQNQQGRFIPNLLVCDDVMNDGRIGRSGFNPKAETKQYKGGCFAGGKTNGNALNYGDVGSNTRYYDLDLWFEIMLERL